ncbi:MAG: hypothetical protein ABR509_06900 [Candidatus Limnocylindria bacterium]
MSASGRRARAHVEVYLELGRDGKRTFAGAIEWPGWCRSGRDSDAALAALVAYGPRYATVLGSDIRFVPPDDVELLEVVEHVQGNATTDFGAPDAGPRSDAEPLRGAALARQRKILRACWKAFDRSMKRTASVELRKGPRGGGRDHARIASHVLDAERSYLARLGKYPDGDAGDATKRMPAMRDAIIEALGEPPDETSKRKLWSRRFFVRRAAWHVLDHTWEVEDRAAPER